jgi:hypothetical protein
MDENHDAAALALVRKMGWHKHNSAMYRGASADKRGNVYVFAASHCRLELKQE